MKVLIASDLRATVYEGRVYLASQHYYIVKRYYEAFGSVSLCSRVLHQNANDKLLDATDLIEQVVEIKSLRESFSLAFWKKIATIVDEMDLIIGRLHSIIGMRILDYAQRRGVRCFAEVMGDAWDGYWNHGMAGKLVAPIAFLMTKKVTWNSDYALYVTNEFLQKRYPCKNPSIAASNVQLAEQSDEVLENRLNRIHCWNGNALNIMTTAAVDVRYKGQEYVIEAIPALNKAGIRVRYILIGGGDQTYLRTIATKFGVLDQVEFLGRRSLGEVFELLDVADIYIQPSLQEGLPRSVIEAMSRGCPVIGAKTAGIPELISPECVVKRKSAKDIAEAVIRLANPETMTELALQNFQEAGGYCDSILTARRMKYFSQILDEIEEG